MFAKNIWHYPVVATSLILAGCIQSTQSADPLADSPANYRPFVEACEPWDKWDKPAPPFKVHGNTYHVGTCGISAVLITGEDGHVLIDSGTEGGADVVMANITTLGFEVSDVQYLLSSHEHFDHVGGMAKIQRASGAYVIASNTAAPVLATGQAAADDPQAGMLAPFEPIRVRDNIASGQTIAASGNILTAISTPGHSPGALSWTWQSCEGEQCVTFAYADSLSPVSRDDYKFSDHPQYLAAYRAGLKRLGSVNCDLLLTPHPSHSEMIKRMRSGSLMEAGACAKYAIGKRHDLEERLAKERAAPDGE